MKDVPSNVAKSLKSVIKIAVQTKRSSVGPEAPEGGKIIVLGNGPSLNDTIAQFGSTALAKYPTMAVNFAGNAPEFTQLRPRYYVVADPIFFSADGNEKVMALWQNLAELVTWDMTIFVPMNQVGRVRLHNQRIKVAGFNFVGIEGFGPFARAAFDAGRGMPRPRNVLIPAIMMAMRLGYNDIYVAGADHSWTKTLDVDDHNRVVTVQPHFYHDDEQEAKRVEQVYRNIHLHDILLSFHIAFKSYFAIEDYARRRGVNIWNATPGSFIDAFRRKSLEEIDD